MIRGNTRCNMSAIALFVQSLDSYETSLPANIIDPSMFTEACRNLEMALARLVHANPCDAYQMMRHLMVRILERRKGYDDYLLLMVATSSHSGAFKGHMMTIVYPMVEMSRGMWHTNIDEVYFDKIERNEGIKAFMVNYDVSDLRLFHGSLKDNVVRTEDCGPDTVCQNEVLIVPLGDVEKEIIFIGGMCPKVGFKAAEDMILPQTHNASLPTIIASTVVLSPRGGSLRLNADIKFTQGALALANLFGCFVQGHTPGIPTLIKLPTNFCSCKLDMFSADSGKTWLVGNIQIIPPQSKDKTY